MDLLAVQGTLRSLCQRDSSKASTLQCLAFFIVQLSHPYMTTGKTIALTRWTFVGRVKSLLFNMLSRLVITFLPRSKRLLISWLQSPSAVILQMAVQCFKITILSGCGCQILLWIRDGRERGKQSEKTIQSLKMSPQAGECVNFASLQSFTGGLAMSIPCPLYKPMTPQSIPILFCSSTRKCFLMND